MKPLKLGHTAIFVVALTWKLAHSLDLSAELAMSLFLSGGERTCGDRITGNRLEDSSFYQWFCAQPLSDRMPATN